MTDHEVTPTITRRSALTGLGAAAVLPMLMGAARGGATAGVGPETVYELRIYHCNDGKLPPLLERFKKREVKIFERLGMHPVAFWTSLEAPDAGQTLTYMLRHPSREAMDAAWKAFSADPEWLVVKAETEKNGALVAKHDHMYLKLTDFSLAP
ncbi:NIPSNAP protein [Bryocella elongata]|uniref:NIPSNAP protein n=1 Tax=Bryocella elongata TaxID=863522 RepID=A0A1H5YPD9_9BACT|nr:NIPSNAP family protein [Bryocella elongata]SEG25894.1 NIPSNAP protein [Bryocella elongata]